MFTPAIMAVTWTTLLLLPGCEENAMERELQDKQAILQTVIDADKLQQYFHTDVFPERVPLRILKSRHLPSNLKLRKFGKEVELIDPSQKDLPHLAILELEITDQRAAVRFAYPPEGITGEATLVDEQDGWSLEKMELREK